MLSIIKGSSTHDFKSTSQWYSISSGSDFAKFPWKYLLFFLRSNPFFWPHACQSGHLSGCYQRSTTVPSHLVFHSSRLAGSPSSHQTSRLVSHRYFLQHQLILGILSRKLALPHAQIYPLSSSDVLPFFPPKVHWSLWRGSCPETTCLCLMESKPNWG